MVVVSTKFSDQPNLARFSIQGHDISMEMEAWKKEAGRSNLTGVLNQLEERPEWQKACGQKKTKYQQWGWSLIKNGEISCVRRSEVGIKGKDGWCEAAGVPQRLLQASLSPPHNTSGPPSKVGWWMDRCDYDFLPFQSNLFLESHLLGNTRSNEARVKVSFPVSWTSNHAGYRIIHTI